MGPTYPTKAHTKDSAPDMDIEANIPQTGTVANVDSNLWEANEERGEEVGRRVIICMPILCVTVLVVLGVLAWGLHELFKPSY
jgi:hypothetical protein